MTSSDRPDNAKDIRQTLEEQGLEQMRNETLAVRYPMQDDQFNAHNESIYMCSSYTFDSAQHAADCFAGDQDDYVYSRYGNPTVTVFEQKLAAMEKAEAAVAYASGMASIYACFMVLLKAGDHVVIAKQVFGSTRVQFEQFVAKFNVDVTWVDLRDLDAWEAAIQPNTKICLCESPSNPLCQVVDIKALSKIIAKHTQDKIYLVIDNSFASPALMNPLTLGADIVMHTGTKYIDGQGRTIGGALCGSAELMEGFVKFNRSVGACMSPFNAWLLAQGLETLSLRMEKICSTAFKLAQWLNSEQHQGIIKSVNYPGLTTGADFRLIKSQMSDFGGVLSFEVKGGKKAAWKIIDAIKLLSVSANLGDAKTTIVHPYTTTHSRLSEEDKALAGITPGLIRIAVGLEHLDDIKADVQQALSQI
jgi:O-succinylhomoserine sulfhydrylase